MIVTRCVGVCIVDGSYALSVHMALVVIYSSLLPKVVLRQDVHTDRIGIQKPYEDCRLEYNAKVSKIKHLFSPNVQCEPRP